MNEVEWLVATDPMPMLEFLGREADPRKLRLFACACVRQFDAALADLRSLHAIEVAERLAEGRATKEQVRDAVSDADDAHEERLTHIEQAATDALEPDPFCAACKTAAAAVEVMSIISFEPDSEAAGWPASPAAARQVQARLLREIFGNPFTISGVTPAILLWNDGLVGRLARAIYEERRWSDLPALARTLEAAGCTDPHIITHCREPGHHFRGCWAVDQILGAWEKCGGGSAADRVGSGRNDEELASALAKFDVQVEPVKGGYLLTLTAGNSKPEIPGPEIPWCEEPAGGMRARIDEQTARTILDTVWRWWGK